MAIKIIVTLVVAFLLVLFGIFNSSFLEFSLFGIKEISTPLSFFVFIVFLAGGVFAGFLSFSDQLRQSLTVRKLRKRIRDLKAALEEREEEVQRVEEKVPSEAQEPEPLPPETENVGIIDDINIDDINDESRLTSSEREIALRKIRQQEKELKKSVPVNKKEKSNKEAGDEK